MELISPSLADETAFLTFYHDFLHNDTENADFYRPATVDFAVYVESLINESKGIGLPEGYVPCHHYWLRHDHGDIVGVIRIRHHIDNPFLSLEGGHIGYDVAPAHRRQGYGTALLALGLKKAKAIGLSQVLVTADEDNPGSRKIIEANGGVLENIVMGKVFPNPIARYWITI
ncbi:GNAT family N-acetyltransferase [Photobacterium sp. TY1-4]|uniref:GNAT family N-acetyltransferase n=1 Tax=Photobacterium sp. TY1-4 TaxID=2899122 RepID=UPI0021C0EC55|nr:GNAT family N-acetyltransferase [Photobacterium sp. TY1-4]UXI04655.1 GNAT family N-acetyltransferase [Photobacterium sp. TY1-4]